VKEMETVLRGGGAGAISREVWLVPFRYVPHLKGKLPVGRWGLHLVRSSSLERRRRRCYGEAIAEVGASLIHRCVKR
jgi:hypothetical protein